MEGGKKMDFDFSQMGQMPYNMNYLNILGFSLTLSKAGFGGLDLIFQILVIAALVAATVGVLVLIGYIIKGVFWLIGQISNYL